MKNKIRKKASTFKGLLNFRKDLYIKKTELIYYFILILFKGNYVQIKGEEYKVFGKKNSDKTFYIIRTFPGAGLLSNYNFILNHIFYAESKEWISVIDYESYPNYYREKNKINNSKNSWEYYFEQPYKFTLNDVYQSSNVFLSDDSYNEFPKELSLKREFELLKDETHVNKLHEISNKIQINISTKKHINTELETLFRNKDKILGVSLRGTDYADASLSPGHSTPPSLEMCLAKVDEIYEEGNFNFIYLATEQQEYLEEFKKQYRDKLIFLDRRRFTKNNDSNKKIITRRFDRENDKYLTGLEYLTEVEGFRNADYFVGSMNNMTIYLLVKYKNLYKNNYLFNLGLN